MDVWFLIFQRLVHSKQSFFSERQHGISVGVSHGSNTAFGGVSDKQMSRCPLLQR